jgi:PAS domain S-box-containing protein
LPQFVRKSEEQKDAEAEVESFHDNLGPFVVAAETTRMAMVFTDAKDPGNPIIFANDSFLVMTGYAREEVLGQDFNFLLARNANADTLRQIRSEFEGKSSGCPDVLSHRKDGTEFWGGPVYQPGSR